MKSKRQPSNGKTGNRFPRNSRNRAIRISVYLHAGCPEFSIRLSENHVRTSEELQLPEAIEDLCRLTDGLILTTGPTGMGTTTLNYIINMINSTRRTKIITIEDPVEFEHATALSSNRKCSVMLNRTSCRHVLRQDPDVIVVGERLLETMETADRRGTLMGHRYVYLLIPSKPSSESTASSCRTTKQHHGATCE
jgi:Tfp pilus assembly pilus retraction ATPase PilT